MIVERDIDCAALYERERNALLDLVGSLPEDERRRTIVPATPEWSVQDVVAHVTAIAADLNAGRLPTGDQDAWTAGQVGSRRGLGLADLRAEWDAEAPRFEEGLRLFGYELGSHFLGDLLQHHADVRHALGRGRIADDEALTAALDFYLDSFHEALVEAGAGSVRVRAGTDTWVVGEGPEVATMAADRFDLLRALGSRRDATQIRAFDWTGDADDVLPRLARYGLPSEGLVEP